MRSQNEEEFLADIVNFAFCQICFPKLVLIYQRILFALIQTPTSKCSPGVIGNYVHIRLPTEYINCFYIMRNITQYPNLVPPKKYFIRKIPQLGNFYGLI